MSNPPRVKICGITRLQDAEHAVEAGAWAVGMIFWPGSPRAIDGAEAQVIGAALRRRSQLVGVFVNATPEDVVATAEAVGLTHVQLHGDEGPSYAEAVARRAGVKVIKAARIRARADLQALDAFRNVDLHLLDTFRAGAPGGTGETFDWDLVAERRSPLPLLLSGGLTPDNVTDAIARTRPWGIDTSSGVEAAPGLKDPAKVEAFLAAVRSTAAEPAAVEAELA